MFNGGSRRDPGLTWRSTESFLNAQTNEYIRGGLSSVGDVYAEHDGIWPVKKEERVFRQEADVQRSQ